MTFITRRRRGAHLSPQVAQYYARLVDGESVAFKTAAAGLINAMVSSGAWGRADWIYFLNTTILSNSLINVKSALYPFVQVGLPDGQFTPGMSWTGDGNAAHYLDNGCDPTVAPGLNFSLNAACLWGRVRSGTKTVSQYMFGNGFFYLEPYFTDTFTYWREHGGADLSVASPAVLTGFWADLRTGVNAAQLRKDGANLATSVAASVSMKNQTLKALGGIFDASSLGLGACGGGAHTQADVDLIDASLSTFFP